MRISDWSSDVCSSDLRARDYPKQLVTRQERIVTLDLHLAGVGVISDELEAGAVGVEHLAAASDEPGFVGLDRTHRVGEPDIGGVRFHVRELPRSAACLRIKGESNTTHQDRKSVG